MKFRFTAEDFKEVLFGHGSVYEAVARQANALLEAHKAKCERVYGARDNENLWSAHSQPATTDTHTSLLWNVEKIGEEK